MKLLQLKIAGFSAHKNQSCNFLFNSIDTRILLFLIFFLTTFSNSSYAQTYPYTHYTVREGLLNSNIHSITRDHYGFIWLATDNGLSRFDGLKFKNYTLEQLGISSFISSVAAYGRDQLIFGSGVNGLYAFDIIKEKATLINKTPVSPSNYLEICDSFVVSLHEYHKVDFISLTTGKKIATDSLSFPKSPSLPYSILKLRNGRLLIGRSDGLYEFSGKRFLKIHFDNGNSEKPIYSIYENQKGEVFLGSEDAIFILKDDKLLSETKLNLEGETRVRYIINDRQGNIWFNPWGSPQIYMLKDGIIVSVADLIGGISNAITRLFYDYDGNIWVSTLGKGFYLFSNHFLINYPVSNSMPISSIRKLVPTHNGLLMGTSDGLAFLEERTGKVTYHKHIPKMTQFVRDICKIGEKEYLVSITDTRFKRSFQDTYSILQNQIRIKYIHSSSLYSDNQTLYSGNWDNRIFVYRLPAFELDAVYMDVFPGLSSRLRINAFEKDDFGNFWVGSQQGLYVIGRDKSKKLIISDTNNIEVFKIYRSHPGLMSVVTSAGFSVYNYDSAQTTVKPNYSLLVPKTTCAAKVSETEYLVGTSDGLIYVNGDHRRRLNIHDGLLSDNINDILFQEGKAIVFIASEEGLMKLDLNKFRDRMRRVPEIDFLTFGKDSLIIEPGNENISMSGDASAIHFNFHSFDYQNPNAIRYQYRINSGEWSILETNELRFASIEPGLHKIELRAGIDPDWGPIRKVLVKIKPPFYRTIGFYVIVAVCVFVVFFLFYRQQIRKYRKRQEAETQIQQKLTELQQQALAGNLNPHFVFNSLNSIQHFINKSGTAEANDYLARFARLMRMHLNMAEKSFISLREELSRLELYLDLEKMRFGEKLSYSIQVDDTINPNLIEIPNMILQPFVENALWHGIMPSNNSCDVRIIISRGENRNLNVEITDTGVGMTEEKIAKRGAESKGVRLISGRLKLLDPEISQPIIFKGLNPGTSVFIMMTPKMYLEKSGESQQSIVNSR